jgi:hypothetical protein
VYATAGTTRLLNFESSSKRAHCTATHVSESRNSRDTPKTSLSPTDCDKSSTTILFHKLPLVPSSQHLLVYLLLPKDTRILAQNPLHCCQQST